MLFSFVSPLLPHISVKWARFLTGYNNVRLEYRKLTGLDQVSLVWGKISPKKTLLYHHGWQALSPASYFFSYKKKVKFRKKVLRMW